MPRGVPSAILTELNKDVISGGFFYLLQVDLRSGTRYWDKRGMSFGGHTYEARVVELSDLPFAAGDSEEVTLKLANADGALTTIDQTESIYGAKVTIRQYVPDAADAHVVFVGWCDEFAEVTPTQATIPIYPETAGMRSHIPKRRCGPICPSEFGKWIGTPTTTNFDGSECPYQRTSTIGFVGALVGDITSGATSITVLLKPGSFDQVAAGMKYIVSDELKIGSEIMLVTSAGSISSNQQTVTVTRGYRSTVAASHTDNSTVLFAKCQKTTSACKRIGMYGNNDNDRIVAASQDRNYFAAFPVIRGFENVKIYYGPAKVHHYTQRVNFGTNPGVGDKCLPLIYGRVRLADPPLLLVNPDNDFLTTLWLIGEGPLATNATNDDQTTPANAFLYDPNPPNHYEDERYIRVNGQLRHDLRPGYGIQTSNGCQDSPQPNSNFFPDVADFATSKLAFWGTAWAALRVSNSDHPTVDAKAGDVNATIGIRYGRCVRNYTGTGSTDFTFKAASDPAWVLMDVMASRRAGAGVPYSDFELQALLDLATNNATAVTNTVYGGTSPRWTFNGVVDTTKPFDEWVSLICKGMSATRPFRNAAGQYRIKSLKAETGTFPTFSDKETTDITKRNIIWENGETSLKKFRRRRRSQIPNRMRASFVYLSEAVGYQVNHAAGYGTGATVIDIDGGTGRFFPGDILVFQGVKGPNDSPFSTQVQSSVGGSSATQITIAPGLPAGVSGNFLKDNARISNVMDFAKIEIVIDDEPSQTLGGTRNIVEKEIDLLGCSTLDEAARRATLALRVGEFCEGGLSNNDGARFKTFEKSAADLEIGDIINLDSYTLDPFVETTYRITDITCRPVTLSSGALVFNYEIEAMIHDNSFFDDTAYVVTSITPIDSGSAVNAAPPAVTGFSVTESGTTDQNGKLGTKLVFNFTPPYPLENFKSLGIMRTSDSSGVADENGWSKIGEITKDGDSIENYPVSGKYEWFCALSLPPGKHADVHATLADGSYKYPRVRILVDGKADTTLGAPTGLAAFGRDSEIFLNWDAYTGSAAQFYKRFNIYRNTVNNSATATKIREVDGNSYHDADPTLVPSTTYYYWVRGVSKLENVVINGTTWDEASGLPLSGFSAVASDNPGSDTGTPTNPPVVNVVHEVAGTNGLYTFLIGVDLPTDQTNYDTVDTIEVQISRDNFTSTVFDRIYELTKPPFSIDWSVNSADFGTYYFRARVKNVFGWSSYSGTLTKATDFANATGDTDIIPIPANLTITTSGAGNNVKGDEFLVEYDLPSTQTESYWGRTVWVNDTNTIPNPDYDSSLSSYLPTGTTGTGAISAGSTVLTDSGKNFTGGGANDNLVGRPVLIFSSKRPTSGAWQYEGLIVAATIQANTATTLTLDQTMRYTMTNIQYYILTVGGLHSWQKMKYVTHPDVDTTGIHIKAGRKHSYRVPTSLLSGYAWVNLHNLWGYGKITSAQAVSVNGIITGLNSSGKIRTATSGARIEIDDSNGLRAYDSGGTVQTQIPVGGTAGIVQTSEVKGQSSTLVLAHNNELSEATLNASSFVWNYNGVQYFRVTSGGLEGDGSQITALDASNVSQGTLSHADVDIRTNAKQFKPRYVSQNTSGGTVFPSMANGELIVLEATDLQDGGSVNRRFLAFYDGTYYRTAELLR
jgi:hypothetical protein